MSKKFSNKMKKVVQMTTDHITVEDSFWDVETRIAGMKDIPGFISAAAVASKKGSDIVDQIVSYWELFYPDAKLASGQRYAWIMIPE